MDVNVSNGCPTWLPEDTNKPAGPLELGPFHNIQFLGNCRLAPSQLCTSLYLDCAL